MNTRMHGSEDALAEIPCRKVAGRAQSRVLIGGLGMGFTLASALKHLGKTAEVVVAELVPGVVEWNRGPLGEKAGNPLQDPRTVIRLEDGLVMDWPDEIISCTMMDIVPTLDMYEETNREFATKYWHWFFYIQGGGFPEAALSADPDRFIHYNLQLKIGPTARKQFSEDVLADYTRCFSDPATVHGICEDYRASAGIDLEHDRIDREQGKKIQSPTLLLWGENGVVGRLWDVPAKWRDLIVDMEGHGISDCGHFVPEEQPGQVLEYLLPFLEKYGA